MNDRTTCIDLKLDLDNNRDRNSIVEVIRRNPLRIFELVRQNMTFDACVDDSAEMTVAELGQLKLFTTMLVASIDVAIERRVSSL